jgi:hypothetical protein
MVSVVLSNVTSSAAAWTSAASIIAMDSNSMIASNASLPAGWNLIFGSGGTIGALANAVGGYTQFTISTIGSLGYRARQMCPTNMKILYATNSAGTAGSPPVASTWAPFHVDVGTTFANSNGTFGPLTICPLATFDGKTTSAIINAASNAALGNAYSIPGRSSALLLKVFLEFDLNPLY